MTTEVRLLRQDEWNSWYENFVRAFGDWDESPEERQFWRDFTEFGRFLGAWDEEECIGTAGAFSLRLTVPGGASVPAAGVTAVSVAATHRRRGVLTSMMRRLLDDVRSWGEPLAILGASEPEIYGRFGYGIGTLRLHAEIESRRVRLSVPPGTDEVRLRYAAPADALDACEEVYARLVPGRPGMLARQPGWERMELLDPERARGGASPLQCVLAERDGETVGYTRFRVKPEWDPQSSSPKGTVIVQQVEGLDPAARAALWRFLFDIDLTSQVVARHRPLDDAWQYQVSDIRRCGLRTKDDLFVRLVDVGAALQARTYQTPVDVVFEVEDAFCPWNEGRWRLTGDAKGASCTRTTDAADLALNVRELGSAYLGGIPLTALAAAGQVRELRQGALAEASLAFGSAVAPWTPHGF
ncbi:GNAT family N-acetyltransferase [Streptomyces sp. NPDC001020]